MPLAPVALIALALASTLSPGQKHKPGRPFPPDALREDLQILWDILDEGHAGLARYTPWKVLREKFDEADAGLTAPLTENEFYLRLLPLIALIKDGHTQLFHPLAPDEVRDSKPVYFPFGLRFLGGKAYLYRNLSAARDIADGSELLAVNGLTVDEILARVLPLIPADAGIRTRKLRLLEHPAFFGELVGLILGRPESYMIRFRPYGSDEVREISRPGIKGPDIAGLIAARYPDAASSPPLYELGFRGETAVLKIRGFMDDPDREKGILSFPNFIEQTFRALEKKKTSRLVIDLRDNGGGRDDYGKLLFAHVADGPFLYYKALEMKHDAYDLFRYTDAGKEDIEALTLMARKNARGWFDVLYNPNQGTQQPRAPHFAGSIAVLINGLTFSATGEIVSLFHYHRKAVVFGEECGAAYYGSTTGVLGLATLPRTKIRVKVPLALCTMAVDGYPPDRGLAPDVAVEPTIEDLLAGRDPVLDRALERKDPS